MTFIKNEIMVPVLKFFDDDLMKVSKWLNTQNPLLGGVSPIRMIVEGKQDNLQELIEGQIEQNGSIEG